MTDPPPQSPFAFLKHELNNLDRIGLRRRPRVLSTGQGPVIRIGAAELLNFASNDYLGLANDPAVATAAAEAARRWGAGAGASRLVSGTFSLHEQLERELASLKGGEAALVYATGTMTNIGVISALVGKRDVVYLDALVHATIHDGARLSGAEQRIFPHNDLAALAALLDTDRARGGRKLIAVDGVYSMDGDTAPLPGLRALGLAHNAMVLVDDAHATGVMGASGRGTLEHYGLPLWDGLVLVGTLSKALGSLGGFVVGPTVLRDYLVNRSRAFIFATGLAPACLGSACEALRIVRDEPWRRDRMWALRGRLHAGLRALGAETFGSETPILPIHVGRPECAVRLQEGLYEAGIYAPAIRPPAVPREACRIRFTVTAAHEEAHIDRLLETLGSLLRKDGNPAPCPAPTPRGTGSA